MVSSEYSLSSSREELSSLEPLLSESSELSTPPPLALSELSSLSSPSEEPIELEPSVGDELSELVSSPPVRILQEARVPRSIRDARAIAKMLKILCFINDPFVGRDAEQDEEMRG